MKKFLKKIGLFKQIKRIYIFIISIKNKIRNLLFPTAIILTYHRVADTSNDPHLLAVSPENFYEQIKYLKQNYRVIELDQLVSEVKNKKLKRKTLVITFDDGYADNLYNAMPILEKLEVPATVFVSSGHIDGSSFHWDKNNKSDQNRPLKKGELEKLSENKFINIGGHTISHPHIPTLNVEQKTNEIVDDKNKLTTFCGKNIYLFSFPFGEFDVESVEIVKKVGYSSAVVLKEKRVSNMSDIYHLPRFLVRNWKLDEFTKNLKAKFL